DALLESRFLIVICSPASSKSAWVNEEIRRFKALGRADRVLAVVVSGEPWASRKGDPASECFPAALRYLADGAGQGTSEFAEPLAADVRTTGDGVHNAQLKILAAMLGVQFDQLRQRDQERRRRQRRIALSLIGIIVLTLLGMLGYSVIQKERAALQAQ